MRPRFWFVVANIARRVMEYAERRVIETQHICDRIVARWHVR